MNVLSLFDGISCGQLALQRANIHYDNYYASEINEHAIKVTQHHFPKTIQLGNIKNIKGKDLSKIELLFGGSPCTGFSSCGLRDHFNNSQSALFWEFIRLLNETNPKYFLLENVVMKKEWQDIISKSIGTEPILIDSALVSAQRRKRLYWTNIPNITQPEDKGLVVRDIITSYDGPDRKYLDQNIIESMRSLPNCIEYTKKPGCGTNYHMDQIICYLDKKFRTLVGQCRKQKIRLLFDDGRIGSLIPIEMERLQTIPDNYASIISSNQRNMAVGNGWTIDVISHMFQGINN